MNRSTQSDWAAAFRSVAKTASAVPPRLIGRFHRVVGVLALDHGDPETHRDTAGNPGAGSTGSPVSLSHRPADHVRSRPCRTGRSPGPVASSQYCVGVRVDPVVGGTFYGVPARPLVCRISGVLQLPGAPFRLVAGGQPMGRPGDAASLGVMGAGSLAAILAMPVWLRWCAWLMTKLHLNGQGTLTASHEL